MSLLVQSSNRRSPCAFSFARLSAMSLSSAADSTTLQRKRDAEAELALLECWGESPPPTFPMETDPLAGEKRSTSPGQEPRKYHRRDSKGGGTGKGSGDRPARQTPASHPSSGSRADGDRHRRHDVDDGQDAVEDGGSTGPGTIPKRIRDVLSSGVPHEHHTPPSQEERTLARARGPERHGTLPSSPSLPLPIYVRCHSEAASGDCEEPDPARSSPTASGFLTGQGWRASTNTLSDVQHRDSSTGAKEGSSSADPRACHGDPGGHPQALPRLIGHSSLPSNSAAFGAHSGPHPPLSPPSGESIQGIVRALRQPDSPHELCPLAAGGRLSPHREDVSQSTCSRASEAAPTAARALIQPTASIENRGNHCYANATLQAVHWLCSFLPVTQEIWVAAMRTVMQRMSLQVRIPDLWTALPWSLAHSRWPRPHQQHDAAEYLSFFRRFLIPDLVTGGWQRRILRQDTSETLCEVTDYGETWPLFISTPISQLPDESRLNLTVQKLIHIWQGEAAIGVMALSEAPMLLSLQLNRFHGTSAHPGALSSHADSPPKDTSRIILDMRISLPCFLHPCEPPADAITAHLIHYRLQAVLMHQGATAQSGHYRAFLTSGNMPRLQYLCDDGKNCILSRWCDPRRSDVPRVHSVVPSMQSLMGQFSGAFVPGTDLISASHDGGDFRYCVERLRIC